MAAAASNADFLETSRDHLTSCYPSAPSDAWVGSAGHIVRVSVSHVCSHPPLGRHGLLGYGCGIQVVVVVVVLVPRAPDPVSCSSSSSTPQPPSIPSPSQGPPPSPPPSPPPFARSTTPHRGRVPCPFLGSLLLWFGKNSSPGPECISCDSASPTDRAAPDHSSADSLPGDGSDTSTSDDTPWAAAALPGPVCPGR